MRGYYKKPEATAEVMTEDGWFRTGDAGVFEDGILTITDRIKDLMKTSCGKYVAPQLIETTLGDDHYIEQVSAIGDLRKYVTALIVPAFEALEAFARERKLSFSSREELIRIPEIVKFYEDRIALRQKDLADHEKVKRFRLLPHAFSQESGEITPTLKLRRKFIVEKYRTIIDALYAVD
jgi:long-chain acyl-CoA synthetase